MSAGRMVRRWVAAGACVALGVGLLTAAGSAAVARPGPAAEPSGTMSLTQAQELEPVASPEAGARIVGGAETSIDQYPWQVQITLNGNPHCGGMLVHPRLVLSAAHCFVGFGGTFTAHTGRTMSGSGGESYAIVNGAIPTDFAQSPLRNDWALVVLGSSATARQPIKIAGPTEGALWRVGRAAAVTGYGAVSEGGPAATQLRVAGFPILDDSVCAAPSSYGFQYYPAVMLCAGVPQGGVDACQGDSGGPLAVPMDGGWRVAGVTSWGNGCARPNYPGIYTRVADPQMSARIQSAGTQLGQAFPGVESQVDLIGAGGVPVGCGAARGASAGAAAAKAAADQAGAKARKKAKKARKKVKKAEKRVALLRRSRASRAAVQAAQAKVTKAKKKAKKAKKKVKKTKKAVNAAAGTAAASAAAAAAACS